MRQLHTTRIRQPWLPGPLISEAEVALQRMVVQQADPPLAVYAGLAQLGQVPRDEQQVSPAQRVLLQYGPAVPLPDASTWLPGPLRQLPELNRGGQHSTVIGVPVPQIGALAIWNRAPRERPNLPAGRVSATIGSRVAQPQAQSAVAQTGAAGAVAQTTAASEE